MTINELLARAAEMRASIAANMGVSIEEAGELEVRGAIQESYPLHGAIVGMCAIKRDESWALYLATGSEDYGCGRHPWEDDGELIDLDAQAAEDESEADWPMDGSDLYGSDLEEAESAAAES